MNTSSDAAEQIVRMTLQGMEVALRVSGSGAKNIAAMLVAIAKDQQKVKGKTSLTNMLKSGRPLKVFSIRENDIKKFTEEAKRYGILFSAIVEKNGKNIDGMIDIMVKEEDASKINRIVERFKLSTVDIASVQSEIEKIKEEKNEKVADKSTQVSIKSTQVSINSTQESDKQTSNLSKKVAKKNLSKNSLENKEELDLSISNKKSVREEIKEIKKELEEKNKPQEKTKVSKHIQPNQRKKSRREK